MDIAPHTLEEVNEMLARNEEVRGCKNGGEGGEAIDRRRSWVAH